MMPLYLEIMLQTWVVWVFHERLSSIKTPKNLVVFTWLNWLLSIKILTSMLAVGEYLLHTGTPTGWFGSKCFALEFAKVNEGTVSTILWSSTEAQKENHGLFTTQWKQKDLLSKSYAKTFCQNLMHRGCYYQQGHTFVSLSKNQT